MRRAALLALLANFPVLAIAALNELPTTAQEVPRQVRGEDVAGVYDRGAWVVVPIPILNPVLDGGVILGVGYFHPQTKEQAAAQPASVSGAGALYTSNGSRGALVGHQGYRDGDRWRYSIVGGRAAVKIDLIAPDDTGGLLGVDWEIDGWAAAFEVDRRLGDSNMYVGLRGRVLQADQTFGVYIPPLDDLGFELENTIKSRGFGVDFMRDTRDLTTNPSSGSLLKLAYFVNAEALGGDTDYQTLDGYLRLYGRVSNSVVLAGEVRGCHKNGDVPLWDACMLSLRGFPATDYLARQVAQARVEARWQMAKRWGLVAFGGAGDVENAFSGKDKVGSVESYGLGLRFMVLPQKRLNMRLDYGRSESGGAWYISVGEAF